MCGKSNSLFPCRGAGVVAACGSGWALRAGIGMTINLAGHPMSVTQCYLAMNDAHVIRIVYSFTSFPSD